MASLGILVGEEPVQGTHAAWLDVQRKDRSSLSIVLSHVT